MTIWVEKVNPEQPTILIVDDDRVNIKVLNATLVREGYVVVSASNGSEALRVARQTLPDLILLDVMMPDVDGFETCGSLKQDPVTTDIPIIFLSALGDVANKVRGFAVGGVDYISKPFERAELLARVGLHLKLSLSSKIVIATQTEKFKQLHDAQQAILISPEDVPEANFGVNYSPVQEAGGDFYDVLTMGHNLFGYFVADISGHDLGASFTTPAIKALLSQYANPVYSPSDILKQVNNVLVTMMTGGNHITAAYARLNRDKRELKLASAGHTPVVYLSSNGDAEAIETAGDVLGAFENVYFEPVTRTVAKGDRFFLYSDGLIEGFGEDKKTRSEGLDRLTEACQSSQGLPISDAIDHIYEEILPGEAILEDDVVLLGVEV